MSVVQIVTVIRPCDSSGGHSLDAEDNHTSTRGGTPIIVTTSCTERTTEEITCDDACKNLSEMVCLLQGPQRSESWLLPQPPSLQASLGVDGMRLSIPLCISRSDVLKMSERTKDDGDPTPLECRDEIDAFPSKTREDSCVPNASSPHPKISGESVHETEDHLAPYHNCTVLEEGDSTYELPLQSISQSSSLGVVESNPDSFTTRYGLSSYSSHGYSQLWHDGFVFRCREPFEPMFRTISCTGASVSLNPSISRIIQPTLRNSFEYGHRSFLEEGSVSECHNDMEYTIARSSLGSSNPASFNSNISYTLPQFSSVQIEESVSTRPQSVVSSERTFENISCSPHPPASLKRPREGFGDNSNFASSRLVEDTADNRTTKEVLLPFKQYFRNNKCILCGKKSTAKDLTRADGHMMTHIPTNKYFADNKCLLCDFVSKSKSRYHAKVHLVTHVKSMIFKCDTCFRSFKWADHLQNQEEIWLTCGQCKSQKLNPHLRKNLAVSESTRLHLQKEPYFLLHSGGQSHRLQFQNVEPVISESYAPLLSQIPVLIERSGAKTDDPSLKKDNDNLMYLGEPADRPHNQIAQPVIFESRASLLSQIPLLTERSGAEPDAPNVKKGHGDLLERKEPAGHKCVQNAQPAIADPSL